MHADLHGGDRQIHHPPCFLIAQSVRHQHQRLAIRSRQLADGAKNPVEFEPGLDVWRHGPFRHLRAGPPSGEPSPVAAEIPRDGQQIGLRRGDANRRPAGPGPEERLRHDVRRRVVAPGQVAREPVDVVRVGAVDVQEGRGVHRRL